MDDISNNQEDLQAGRENPQPDEVPPAQGLEQDQPDGQQDEPDQPTDSQQAEIIATVEAILFSTDTPLAAGKIANVAEVTQRQVKQAVRALNERYEQVGGSFRIEEIGGGFQMLTQPQYHHVLGRLSKTRSDTKLSQAALETLAIIAYRQPILRADVEAIRGVASGEVIRSLLEKQLIKIVGRAEVIGRPMLYGTTRRFLDVFGLGSLEDLPRVEELRGGAREDAQPAPVAGDAAAPAEQSAAANDETSQPPQQPASSQPAQPQAQDEEN